MGTRTPTHLDAGNATSSSTWTKANFRPSDRGPELSTASERSKATQRDTSAATGDMLVERALPMSCIPAAIYDIHQGHCSTAPCHIAQLPVEILNEIFVHCLPQGLYGDDYLSPRIKHAPMLLCHVCSHWRQVALSLTLLWTSFSGRCPELNPVLKKSSPNTFELVRCFLARSQNHRISIEFGDRTLPSVRQILFANLHRWGTVSIKPNDEIVKDLLGLPLGVATSLESLSMNILFDCKTTFQEIPRVLPLFPNIRRLRFSTIHRHNSLLSNVPWKQLTHIQLRCKISMDECAVILGQCGQAQHIQIAAILPSGPINSMPATLPYLAHLSISSFDDVGILLDHFTLPSLRSLQLSTRPTTRRNFRTIEDLTTRSSCALKVLYIDDLEMPEEDLVGYLTLPCLRSVEELEIHNFNISDRTLSLLVYPDAASEDGILPSLEKLTLHSPITSDGLFSQMIASRLGTLQYQKSPASLQHVNVQFPRSRFQQRDQDVPPHNLDILRFAEFAEQGLSVTWKWH